MNKKMCSTAIHVNPGLINNLFAQLKMDKWHITIPNELILIVTKAKERHPFYHGHQQRNAKSHQLRCPMGLGNSITQFVAPTGFPFRIRDTPTFRNAPLRSPLGGSRGRTLGNPNQPAPPFVWRDSQSLSAGNPEPSTRMRNKRWEFTEIGRLRQEWSIK